MISRSHRTLPGVSALVLLLLALTADTQPVNLSDWLHIGGDIRVRLDGCDGEDLNDRVHDALGGKRVMGENDEVILTRVRLQVDARRYGRSPFLCRIDGRAAQRG